MITANTCNPGYLIKSQDSWHHSLWSLQGASQAAPAIWFAHLSAVSFHGEHGRSLWWHGSADQGVDGWCYAGGQPAPRAHSTVSAFSCVIVGQTPYSRSSFSSCALLQGCVGSHLTPQNWIYYQLASSLLGPGGQHLGSRKGEAPEGCYTERGSHL